MTTVFIIRTVVENETINIKKANKRNTQRPFYHKDYVNRHIDI